MAKALTAVEKARQRLQEARKAKGTDPTYTMVAATVSKEDELKAKMAAVMPKAKAPSMVPAKKEKKEKAPPPPDLREIDIDDDDRQQIARLVNQAAEYKRMEKDGKQNYGPLSDRIKALIQDNESVHKFMCDGHRANLTKTQKSTINKDKLLAAGVAPGTITACTDITDSWMLTVTPAGVPDSED